MPDTAHRSKERVELDESEPQKEGSRLTVYAALIGNALVAITKFVAAGISGSAAMLSEGVHSIVDTGNEVLLLYGMHRAAQPPTTNHPMGHGRELYFWSFIVALMIFAAGACVSLYQGVARVLTPQPLHHIGLNYAVIALSAIFEGSSWWIARKNFRRHLGSSGYLEAARRSKDPTMFTVLFEDSAALLGLFTAFCGVLFSQLLKNPVFDGAASIIIGLILAFTAAFLVRETKGLLIGEKANPHLEAGVKRIAEEDQDVERANGVLTVHLGPDHVVVMLSVKFKDAATARAIEASVQRIEQQLRQEYPEVAMLLVKPQTTAEWSRRHVKLEQATANGE